MSNFNLKNPYQPTGDQPAAVAALVDGYGQGLKH